MYQLASFKDKTFNVIHDLSDAQYAKINEHLNTVDLFFKDVERLNIVLDAFEIYHNTLKNYIKKEITYHQLSTQINTHIHNFLAAFRSFIDHWETYLSRKYGNDSKELNEFKITRSQEFDQYFSYRFIYELRNYTLHCDMPLSTLIGKTDDNDNNSVNLVVNRDKLLNRFKWPKKVGLEHMPLEFDLKDHIIQAVDCLKRIQGKALNIGDIEKIYTSAEYVVNIKKENPMYSEFAIIEFDGTTKENYTPKKVHKISIGKAEVILKMIQ